MPPEAHDVTRLTDMLHYARPARQILGERGLDAFQADEPARLAVVRCVEVIGEAGHKVSPATQATLASIPWHLMWGMRNRLIHDYGNTDYGIVHRVVRDELPNLISAVELFLARAGKTSV